MTTTATPPVSNEEAKAVLAWYADHVFALHDLTARVWDSYEELLNALEQLSSFDYRRAYELGAEAGRRIVAFGRKNNMPPTNWTNATSQDFMAYLQDRMADVTSTMALAEAYIEWFTEQLGVVRSEREAH